MRKRVLICLALFSVLSVVGCGSSNEDVSTVKEFTPKNSGGQAAAPLTPAAGNNQ